MKEKMLIGITDCSKYANYEKWMLATPDVETIKLSYHQNNLDDLKRCDGILLTGGEDVSPEFYGKPEFLELCDPYNMDPKRDEFELAVIKYTQENQVPVLGICRGLQITNVFFGGTLIPDIPSAGKSDHSKFHEGEDRYHEIRLNPFSRLKTIANSFTGEVNSSHHQSADHIAKELVATAFSGDGIVEALERKSPEEKAFMLLVQWHPERMRDPENPLSKNIKLNFLESVLDSAQKEQNKTRS